MTHIFSIARRSLLALPLFLFAVSPGRAVAEGANNLTEFEALSPYGSWLMLPEYGRVWRPAVEIVGAEFRPYSTGGHWVFTDLGWAWASDWDWGWAPFHYGRWMWDSAWGWLWVPGTVWGPAWVDWRFGGGYVGWAPLAPTGHHWLETHPRWFFCPSHYMTSNHVSAFGLLPEQVGEALAVARPASMTIQHNGAHFFAGPPAASIGKAMGQPIQALAIAPPSPGIVQPGYHVVPPRSTSRNVTTEITGRQGSALPNTRNPAAPVVPTVRLAPPVPAPPQTGTGAPRPPLVSRPAVVSPFKPLPRPIASPPARPATPARSIPTPPTRGAEKRR